MRTAQEFRRALPRAIFALAAASFGIRASGAQALGTWEILAPLPTPRQEVGVAELDGLVYVVGGFDASAQSVNTVERFDPGANDWEEVAPLPAPLPLNHVPLAATGGGLYAVGGLTQTFTAVDSLFRYDPGTNAWSPRRSLPSPRGSSAVGVIDGRIYSAGGLPAGRNRELAVYDPGLDEWTQLAPMPTGRDHAAGVGFAGKFYVFSGRAGAALRGAVEIYHPGLDRWSPAAPILTPRAGIAAAEVAGRLYVFGGEGNPLDPMGVFDEVEEYNPAANLWRSMEPMPLPRHGIGAAVVGGRIFIPGGGPVEGLGTTDRHDAFTPPPIDTDSAIRLY